MKRLDLRNAAPEAKFLLILKLREKLYFLFIIQNFVQSDLICDTLCRNI